MAKDKGLNDTSVSKQQALFDSSLEEGSFDIALGVKQHLSRDLKGFDRYLVAAQISKAMLKDLSKDSLDKKNILRSGSYVLEFLGSDVLNPEDRDLIELARLQEQERTIKAKMDAIRSRRGLR